MTTYWEYSILINYSIIFNKFYSSKYPVSVIVPVFNKLNYLERCFNSLFNQKFKDFEIIIVDDCSSDNSTGYVLEQMKQHPNIKLLRHNYNQGTSLARVHGVLESSGIYITSLDPDDEYFDYTIEKAYENVANNEVDILEFEISVRHIYGRRYTIPACSHKKTNASELTSLIQNFDYSKINWNICNKLIKRNIYLKAINLFNPFVKDKKVWYAEDLLHISTIYLFINSYTCLDYLGYFYHRGNSDSAERNNQKSQKDLQLDFIKSLASYFYARRSDVSSCSLSDFLLNKSNLDCYNKITELDRANSLDCSNFVFDGFKTFEKKEFGYCLIYLI